MVVYRPLYIPGGCWGFLSSTVQVAVTPKGEGAEEPSGKSATFTLVRQVQKLGSCAFWWKS